MSDKSARAVQFPTGSSRDTPPSTEEAACRGARALPEAGREIDDFQNSGQFRYCWSV